MCKLYNLTSCEKIPSIRNLELVCAGYIFILVRFKFESLIFKYIRNVCLYQRAY